jgi:hypothetical protein
VRRAAAQDHLGEAGFPQFLQQHAGGEAAIMRHRRMARRQVGAIAEQHVMRGHRPGRRLIHRVEQTVGFKITGDRLQIGHDDAQKPVIGEDAARLLERFRHLVKIEMLDAMGRPHGVGRASVDRRQIGDVRHQIRQRGGIDVDAELAPRGEHRRQPR